MWLIEKSSSYSPRDPSKCERLAISEGVWECLSRQSCKFSSCYGGDMFCKHPNAANTAVQVGTNKSLPQGHVVASTSYGIRGMRERVEQLGGKIKFDSQPGNGFSLMVKLPQPAAHSSKMQTEE